MRTSRKGANGSAVARPVFRFVIFVAKLYSDHSFSADKIH